MCGFGAKGKSRTGLSCMSGSARRTGGHTTFSPVSIPTTLLLCCVNIASRPGPPLAGWMEIPKRHDEELTCFCVRAAARARVFLPAIYLQPPAMDRRSPALYQPSAMHLQPPAI